MLQYLTRPFWGWTWDNCDEMATHVTLLTALPYPPHLAPFTGRCVSPQGQQWPFCHVALAPEQEYQRCPTNTYGTGGGNVQLHGARWRESESIRAHGDWATSPRLQRSLGETGCHRGLRGVYCHVAWPRMQTGRLLAAGCLQEAGPG